MKRGILTLSRRGFMKGAGLACGYFLLGAHKAKEAAAAVLSLVGLRQQSVYNADADKKIYKLRKSQDNPMVKVLYSKEGFLNDGPNGHTAHELLHTHYTDRGKNLADLREKGVELAL